MDETPYERPAFAGWLERLVRGPVEPAGDYFERLRVDVERSAPLCAGCV